MHGVVATLNRGVGVSREAIGDQPSVGRRDLVPALEMDAAKLDGTARGGVVLAIKHELQVPILFIGTGEKLEDVASFDSREFVDSLLAPVP